MKSNYYFPALLSLVFVFSLHGISRAANFTVNNNGDTSDVTAGDGICADAGGNCTLRAAVEETNALSGNDAINFVASLTNATITLTTGVEIQISGTNGTLQINGLGADMLTIDGGAGSNRIFFTNNAANITITGVTMQGGGTLPQGGAIFADGGTLVLISVLIRNNVASSRGGGVYYNGGTNHRILNSTISGNSAASNAGGIWLASGTLFVANTTISGNTTTSGGSSGGGVFISGGSATFRNSTITNNSAAGGGGGFQVNATLNFGNTIIAGNSAPGFPEILNFGGTTSAGNNFVGDSAGDSSNTNVAITYQMSDILNQNPMLGVLQNNGGPTPTRALLAGSPAINTGDNAKAVDPFNNSPLTTDQRGYAPRTEGIAVDIGAYEFNAVPTAANVAIGGRVTFGTNGLSRASVTLTNSNGEIRSVLTSSFGYFRFDEVPASETYIVSVNHKRYIFTPQVVSVVEDLTELNFTAEP